MNCKHCQKLLHEYLDETLSLRTRTSIEEHLQGCDDCREALLRERNFSASMSQLLLHETERLTLRPEARGKVLNALESGVALPKARRSYRQRLWRPALALTGAACLLVVLLLIFGGDKSPPIRPAESPIDHPRSYIMCMATTYADDTRTDWIERRMIVETKNGVDGYLEIIARKTPKVNQTKNEKEGKS